MSEQNEYWEALANLCGGDPAYFFGDESVDLLQLLVVKATPRKGEMKTTPGFVAEVASVLCCPNCGEPIVNVWNRAEYKPNYCHYCGQKFDWSDKKEEETNE